MKAYDLKCSLAVLWLLLPPTATASENDGTMCYDGNFGVFDFPVGGPWLVLRQTVTDPMPLRVSGFTDSAKASSVTSILECSSKYSSSFKVSKATITKGNTSYKQQGVGTEVTQAFDHVPVNGVWYISVDAEGPGTCRWSLKISGCEDSQQEDASGNDKNNNNNQQNNNNNHNSNSNQHDSGKNGDSEKGNNNQSGNKNDNGQEDDQGNQDPPLNIRTMEPTASAPTNLPTRMPSDATSRYPSLAPSDAPSQMPSDSPSSFPSTSQSDAPSQIPSDSPSSFPSLLPSDVPSQMPSDSPSLAPIHFSLAPSDVPSNQPSMIPSDVPSDAPSLAPIESSRVPSDQPSRMPSDIPSRVSVAPSDTPSDAPSLVPSALLMPSVGHHTEPTRYPTTQPVKYLSELPSQAPFVLVVSDAPSDVPTDVPSPMPIASSPAPSAVQVILSSERPNAAPTYLFDDDIVEASAITGASTAGRAQQESLCVSALLLAVGLINSLL